MWSIIPPSIISVAFGPREIYNPPQIISLRWTNLQASKPAGQNHLPAPHLFHLISNVTSSQRPCWAPHEISKPSIILYLVPLFYPLRIHPSWKLFICLQIIFCSHARRYASRGQRPVSCSHLCLQCPGWYLALWNCSINTYGMESNILKLNVTKWWAIRKRYSSGRDLIM